jgi:RNA polymerase sigma factor for flagellar operon FliA
VSSRESAPTGLRVVTAADSAEVLERFTTTLELVEIIAHQIRRTIGGSADRDDLIASGREGLLDAARRFDPARGVTFRTYANYRVRGAMIDGVRRTSALPRRAYQRLLALQAASEVIEGEAEYSEHPASVPADVTEAEDLLAEQLSAMAVGAALATMAGPTMAAPAVEDWAAFDEESSQDPEETLERAELIAKVRQALEGLSPEASAVVRRHYMEGEPLGDIARDFGMSKSWASRLLNRTAACLANRLRALA